MYYQVQKRPLTRAWFDQIYVFVMKNENWKDRPLGEVEHEKNDTKPFSPIKNPIQEILPIESTDEIPVVNVHREALKSD